MKFTEEEQAVLEGIPAGKKQELLNFAQFLSEAEHSSDDDSEAAAKIYRKGGWVKGQIWMSEDFNDSLEFVSDKEMRVLEAVRESKRPELQEAAV